MEQLKRWWHWLWFGEPTKTTMKVMIQWAQKNPQGWQEIDASDWASLPKLPIPAVQYLLRGGNRRLVVVCFNPHSGGDLIDPIEAIKPVAHHAYKTLNVCVA